MTLSQKLHAIRCRQIPVVKNGKAPKYRYATMGDVMAALHPVLREYEISVHFESVAADAETPCAADEALLRMVVSDGQESMSHTFSCKFPEPILNSQGASVVNLPMRAAGGKTHARRTELILYFCLFTGDDDECERFAELSDSVDPQTGMKGVMTVTDDTRWQTLYQNGIWAHCAGPEGVGKLGDYYARCRGKAMMELLDRNPRHAGLIGWLASHVEARMERVQAAWSDVQDATGVPSLESCSLEQLRDAARWLRERPEPKGAA